MEISGNQLDEASLAAFGVEALQLLATGNIAVLAERFGYALAFDQEPASAIQRDLESSLASVGANSLALADAEAPSVTYFKPSDPGLFALIEGRAPTNNGKAVLVELIVAGNEAKKRLALEQISDVA
ncbi:MAG TPA: hypothetical protein VFG67_09880 [Oleiagrimonas sp.]|nr:hypothetical protein [Oleiagrimonas sp.]